MVDTHMKNITRRQKKKAIAIVNASIKNGSLKKSPCEVCGNEKVEGHHEDYSKPLEVRWFCRRHHIARHIEKESLEGLTEYSRDKSLQKMFSKQNKIKEKIDEKKEYTLSDIESDEMFPGIRGYRTIRRLVNTDIRSTNILKAKIEGRGNKKRYTMIGENIIKFVEAYGPVMMTMARKPKSWKKRT